MKSLITVSALLGSISLLATAEAQSIPGEVFSDCEDCPEMVVIPAGAFNMGNYWMAGYITQIPVHLVTISQFAAGRTEVTNTQYNLCVLDNVCPYNSSAGNRSITRNGSRTNGNGNKPVINISWIDAAQYAFWLSGKTGEDYRLFSEAEWEYARLANTTTPYESGWYWTCLNGNILDESHPSHGPSDPACNDGHHRTADVGSYIANRLGLFDMTGNVEEWVMDCWNPNYDGAPIDGSPWLNGECFAGVIKGGSWGSVLQVSLASYRYAQHKDAGSLGRGFRIARSIN